jgi:hypothetical protein
MQFAYNTTWKSDGGVTMRGTFAPGCGHIKPNTVAIRRLLLDEGLRYVEKKDWQEVLGDDDKEMTLEAVEDSESEGDTPA